MPCRAISRKAWRQDSSAYVTKPIKVSEFMAALYMVLAFAETGVDGAVTPELP